MAKATQTKKKTTTKITFNKKSGGDTMKCNICGGSGVQKKPAKKNK